MSLVEVTTPRDGVRLITLNRPQALNTLNEAVVRELRAVLAAIAADRDCRVVVLTGAGRAFCAGLDLNGYGETPREDDETMAVMYDRQVELSSLALALHELPQPVIAAVNGAAAGGGLALVCASDIRIGVPDAIFAVSFIRAGYSACDIGVSWLLPRIMGAGRAHELMLTGRRFSADEALTGGLLSAVATPEELLATALAKADEILLNPPRSVALTKVGMWGALEQPSFRLAVEFENRQQMVSAFTADRVEATRAFLERRPPSYDGR